MRIVCEKCAAAYAIDDRLITPRGIRAQCPRCRHQHLLTTAMAVAAAEAQAEPVGQAAPAAPVMLARLSLKTGEARRITPVAVERVPEEAFAPDDRLPAPPLDEALAPPRMSPLADAPLPPPARAPAEESPGAPEAISAAPERVEPARCGHCGLVLEDAFDAAIGACDACRARQSDPEVSSVPRPDAGTVDPAEAGNDVSRTGGGAPPGGAAANRAVDRRVVIAAAVALSLLALAGVGGLVIQRPSAEPLELTIASDQPMRVSRDAIGPTLAEAQRLLMQDDGPAYAGAALRFEAVLRERPRDEGAMAGWVTALALGQGTRLPEAQRLEVTRRLEEVSKREGPTPELMLARAHLLLTRPRANGHQDEARRLAGEALALAKDAHTRAWAHFALGRAAQVTSAALAERSFDAALAADPSFAAAVTARAAARLRAHDVAGALADLDERLAQAPENGRARLAKARLLATSGRQDEARTGLVDAAERYPGDTRYPLALAVLGYQHGASAQARTEALQWLREKVAAKGAQPTGEGRTLRLHLGLAERTVGDPAVALQLGLGLVEEDPADPAARLLVLVAALERSEAQAAAAAFDAVQPRLDDPALAKLLEGRVRLLEGRAREAEAALVQSVELDPRRTDARIWAGIAALAGGRRAEAVAHLQSAALADPLRAPPGLDDPFLFLAPWELLRGAALDRQALAQGRDDLLPHLHEAVLRYHLGDVAAASRSAGRVVAIDPGNGLAQAWRTLAALQLGDRRAARQGAEAARAHGRTLGMAQLARGLVAAREGRAVDARRALTEAVVSDRNLLGAEVALARLELEGGDRGGAKARALRVLRADPEVEAARRVLLDVEASAPTVGANR